MLKNVEDVATAAELMLSSNREPWVCCHDSPHISRFSYELLDHEPEAHAPTRAGSIDGFRLCHDWTVASDEQWLDEADALDGDALSYVDALVRELAACATVFDEAPSLAFIQRTTIVRRVQPAERTVSDALVTDAVACLAMMDAPVFMLVDPHLFPEAGNAPAGKLRERGHAAALLNLGFVRMVTSDFLWAWNREMADTVMVDYSYDELVAAKKKGLLDAVQRP